jgi:hypothetical protein
MNKGEVVIRTPCGADFDAMDPRGTARFCGSCNKLVHDLSLLGEAKARALLRSAPESLCVRYLHDETGKIWFGEAPTKLVATDRLTRGKRAMAAAALAVTPMLIQACGGADPGDDERWSRTDAGAEGPSPEQQGIAVDENPMPGVAAAGGEDEPTEPDEAEPDETDETDRAPDEADPDAGTNDGAPDAIK